MGWGERRELQRQAEKDGIGRVGRLIDHLEDVYTREGVGVWLLGRHRRLGGRRPVDLLVDGNVREVEALVDQLRSGAVV
jgi:uncharacterized protein (DUF2384 family)